MSDVDNLAEVLGELSVESERPALVVKTDVEDDGYNSKDEEEEGEEEEVELEPLTLPVRTEVQETIQLVSRGPIHTEHDAQRFSPYSRDHRNLVSSGDYISADTEATSFCLPTPNVLILRKLDTNNPSKLEVPVRWTNKYEICIDRHRLPEETYYGKGEGGENKVQLFIQLNPNVCELKSFLADVRSEAGKDGKTKTHFIGPIVISLKTELEDSQERKLLDLTSMEERTAAFNLVNQKEISQLTSGIGPHKDTGWLPVNTLSFCLQNISQFCPYSALRGTQQTQARPSPRSTLWSSAWSTMLTAMCSRRSSSRTTTPSRHLRSPPSPTTASWPATWPR